MMMLERDCQIKIARNAAWNAGMLECPECQMLECKCQNARNAGMPRMPEWPNHDYDGCLYV